MKKFQKFENMVKYYYFFQFFSLSEYDVPLRNSFGAVFESKLPYFLKNINVMMRVTKDVWEEDVYTLNPDSRRCRFAFENESMWAFKYYSYSACIAQCVLERKMELCKCNDVYAAVNAGKLNIVLYCITFYNYPQVLYYFHTN